MSAMSPIWKRRSPPFSSWATASDNAFLLESVQGGEARGRYSIIGLKPDLIWRTRGDVAEIDRQALSGKGVFSPRRRKSRWPSLRALIAETRMALPDGLPPMAVGLFGYLGYDMARQVEHLPNAAARYAGPARRHSAAPHHHRDFRHGEGRNIWW